MDAGDAVAALIHLPLICRRVVEGSGTEADIDIPLALTEPAGATFLRKISINPAELALGFAAVGANRAGRTEREADQTDDQRYQRHGTPNVSHGFWTRPGPAKKMPGQSARKLSMDRGSGRLVAAMLLLGIGLDVSPGRAQMRGPRISHVGDVTCVANWERRFQVISPGVWEMRMADGNVGPFLFRETDRSRASIFLKGLSNQRLTATLNLNKQRIKYVIPGQEGDPLFFNIQSFNINGGGC